MALDLIESPRAAWTEDMERAHPTTEIAAAADDAEREYARMRRKPVAAERYRESMRAPEHRLYEAILDHSRAAFGRPMAYRLRGRVYFLSRKRVGAERVSVLYVCMFDADAYDAMGDLGLKAYGLTSREFVDIDEQESGVRPQGAPEWPPPPW
ncbi:hypothetical protein [Paludisphaera mucosa]|uniref:Uncharacterized protein n=1 Tax=Paludisphaera mucosa TaxID=3030827 RepID=A0ABT6FLS7_9BACT|nr:hypothetical protein [Paludisphaera mucosa]MDG3008507.1 hypothetical protein [Paludisphaera mucosa]